MQHRLLQDMTHHVKCMFIICIGSSKGCIHLVQSIFDPIQRLVQCKQFGAQSFLQVDVIAKNFFVLFPYKNKVIMGWRNFVTLSISLMTKLGRCSCYWGVCSLKENSSFYPSVRPSVRRFPVVRSVGMLQAQQRPVFDRDALIHFGGVEKSCSDVVDSFVI